MPGGHDALLPPRHRSPPIALQEVIRFLVESEPLKNVGEVSRYLETVASERGAHDRAMVSVSYVCLATLTEIDEDSQEERLNLCVESEKHISESLERGAPSPTVTNVLLLMSCSNKQS